MEFVFNIHLSYHAFLPYYQGLVEKVEVKDSKGRVLHINGRHFRPFLTKEGLRGTFKLHIDEAGNFKTLKRI